MIRFTAYRLKAGRGPSADIKGRIRVPFSNQQWSVTLSSDHVAVWQRNKRFVDDESFWNRVLSRPKVNPNRDGGKCLSFLLWTVEDWDCFMRVVKLVDEEGWEALSNPELLSGLGPAADPAVGSAAPYQPDPQKRRAIEQAAIEETKHHFITLGYKIMDRQLDNVGWDLEAVKGAEEILLEVKGLSGAILNVELTPNEYAQMRSLRSKYAVCVLVGALGPERSLSVFRFCTEFACWRDAEGRRLSISELTAARLASSDVF